MDCSRCKAFNKYTFFCIYPFFDIKTNFCLSFQIPNQLIKLRIKLIRTSVVTLQWTVADNIKQTLWMTDCKNAKQALEFTEKLINYTE